MSFRIDAFRASLTYDGARASLFDVNLTLPTFATGGIGGTAVARDISFKARAASLPGDTVSAISVNYFGREIKVAGTRSFPDYTLTIINDENFLIRNAMELWMSALNRHVDNTRSNLAAQSFEYQAPFFEIRQYKKTGPSSAPGAPASDPAKIYNIVGAFPTDVSPIDLDWGSDTIEEFTVTFAYQWWESVTPGTIATTDASSG